MRLANLEVVTVTITLAVIFPLSIAKRNLYVYLLPYRTIESGNGTKISDEN